MISPQGLASNPDFQVGCRPAIDTSNLYYDGNFQGGIMGGVTLAVSPDVRRAVLGVTGMDYGNLLLARSTDFTTFSTLLGFTYPDASMYPVILDLLDQLWDRGDPDGYAPYMTSHPLPDTPQHQVLMQVAYGDFQVSMYAGAAEARTVGVSAYDRRWIPIGRATGICSTASPRSATIRSMDRRSRSGIAPRAGCTSRRSGTFPRTPARRTSIRIRTHAARPRRSSRYRITGSRTAGW
jgi:hypothetical protein